MMFRALSEAKGMDIKMDTQKKIIRGEIALLIVVLINSFGVVLMLYSGAGISTVSSVPYAFEEVTRVISLGTWTYIFQGFLVVSLMILQKRFVPHYLFSFVIGFVFGICIDAHEVWIKILPQMLPFRVLYFAISYLIIAFGIALSNRCKMPIVPTDLFPRELSKITGITYPRIKVSFDVICLIITTLITAVFLGHVKGLGVGTILAAFTMGKVIGVIGDWMDQHVIFVSFFEPGKNIN